MKHEWRKKEKEFYLPKTKPELIEIPTFKYLTIAGEGSPANESFPDCISVLYSVSYAIKMTLKKSIPPKGYVDYTVYPLEGIWDLNERAKKSFDGTINKEDFVFNLMIRQPDFIMDDFVGEMVEWVKKKKPHPLLTSLKFESIAEGTSIQMMHIGSYDDEPTTFKIMEDFAQEENQKRISKAHREIYLSDFRKVAPGKLKTVLRFQVEQL